MSLKTAGIDVIPGTAYGEDAVRLVSDGKADAVLLDIHLKGVMNGIDAAKEIGKRGNAAIVFLSAYDYKEQVKKDHPFNYAGYLSKPVREEVLLKTVREAIKQ